MKKLLLSALIGLFGVTAVAQDGEDEIAQVTYGHVKDTYVYMAEGLKLSENGTMGIAIRIPALAIQQYVGGKIIGMEIAAASDASEQPVHIFLKKGDLKSGDKIASADGHISWTKNPSSPYTGICDNVYFDESWAIPNDLQEDIFLGLYTDVEANKWIIGVSAMNQSAKAGTVYISDSYDPEVKEPDNWDDISTIKEIAYNNPVIRAIIELPSENYQNVLMFENGYMPNICKADDTTTGLFYLKNDGLDTVNSFEMTTTCGEKSTTMRFTYEEGGIAPGKATTVAQPFPVPVFGTGHYTVEISKVNDEENTATEKRALEFDLVAVPADVAEKHTRRSLYEYYTSETDHNSGAYMEDLVMPSVKKTNGHVILLPHHAGDKFKINPFDVPAIVEGKEDKMTLADADLWAIKLCCNDPQLVTMPSSTVDRTIQLTKIDLAGRTFGKHPMGVGTLTPQACDYIFPDALSIPTFASVDLENKYNAENNTVEIKASGSIADLLPEGEKAKLSLFLIEESVLSDSQEFPESASSAERWPDGLFTHPRVIRQNVTEDFWGDELEPGQDFVKTYKVELESTRWNPDHMKVVAVIQRPETNDHLHLDVINAVEKPMTETYEEPASINSVVVENNGQNGIYDLQGRKLTKAAKGINIINGKKVLVK